MISTVENVVSMKKNIKFDWKEVEDQENVAASVTIDIDGTGYDIEILCDSADRPPYGEYSAYVEGEEVTSGCMSLLKAKSEVEKIILDKYPNAHTAKQSPMGRL